MGYTKLDGWIDIHLSVYLVIVQMNETFILSTIHSFFLSILEPICYFSVYLVSII